MAAYRVWQVGVSRDAPLGFDHKERSSTSCSSANCSVALVVSPLVSSMIDQVESLRKQHVQGSHLSLPLSHKYSVKILQIMHLYNQHVVIKIIRIILRSIQAWYTCASSVHQAFFPSRPHKSMGTRLRQQLLIC